MLCAVCVFVYTYPCMYIPEDNVCNEHVYTRGKP